MITPVLRLVSDRTAVTILVVEDQILIRMEICEFLRASGYHVFEASNGREAQSIFQQGARIDFLFTDIDMPEMSGVELARWVREKFPGTAILLGSGNMEGVKDAHLGTVFAKPYNYDELLALIISRFEQRQPPHSK